MIKECFTCKHWKGDKKKQTDHLRRAGEVCMDFKRGWPEFGKCDIFWDWGDFEIEGDCHTASVEFAANFGCIHHEQD